MLEFHQIPRIPLAITPTPIVSVPCFAEALGAQVEIYVKRDDNTGLALGGNKARKLEYLLADANAQGADVLITEGGIQSNHARMTAAAARRMGMDAVLVLQGKEPTTYQGNLLLDKILDAQIRFVDPDGSITRQEVMEQVAAEYRERGRHPYLIPTGGSTGLGALGYIRCVEEIVQQSGELGVDFDWIVHPIGSGGTQAGLLIGKKLFDAPFKVLGIAAANEDFAPEINRINKEVERILQRDDLKIKSEEIYLNYDYYGPEYGVVSPKAIQAMELLARTEGIIVGPIYTGKALAGLIDLIQKDYFRSGEKILFVHTGGAPALFAMDLYEQG